MIINQQMKFEVGYVMLVFQSKWAMKDIYRGNMEFRSFKEKLDGRQHLSVVFKRFRVVWWNLALFWKN